MPKARRAEQSAPFSTIGLGSVPTPYEGEKGEFLLHHSFCTPEDSLAAEPVRIIFAVSFCEAPTSDLVGLIEERKLAICP